MRRNLPTFLLCALCFGCATITPLARFDRSVHRKAPPEEFAIPDSLSETVAATISFRAPGIRGRAKGIVRRAAGGNMLVELYGRGELFLKVYFTRAQTVLWPTVGMPAFFGADDTPTLSETVNPLLPKWRLDDVLPIPHQPESYADGSTLDAWATDDSRVLERVVRQGCDGLIKTYEAPLGMRVFPYRRVTLATEDGGAKMKWSLRQSKRN